MEMEMEMDTTKESYNYRLSFNATWISDETISNNFPTLIDKYFEKSRKIRKKVKAKKANPLLHPSTSNIDRQNYFGIAKMRDGQVLYECEFCQKQFASRSHISVHRRSHTGERPHVCKVCNKGFSLKGNMEKHLKKMHPQNKEYIKCPHCEKTYSSWSSLQDHTVRIHRTEKSFHCGKCSKRFAFDILLQAHMDNHVKKEKIRCTSCGKTFPSETVFKDHQKKLLQCVDCKFCGREFETECGLQDHLRFSSGITMRYICCVCDASLSHRNSLSRHIKRRHLFPDKWSSEWPLEEETQDITIKTEDTSESEDTTTDKINVSLKTEETGESLHNRPTGVNNKVMEQFFHDAFSNSKFQPATKTKRVVKSKKTVPLKEELICKKCGKLFGTTQRLVKHISLECYYTALQAVKASKLATGGGAQK